MPEPLAVCVYHIGINPYHDTIPDEEFQNMVNSVIKEGARGIPNDESFAFVLLDPTASRFVPARDAVLAIATVGAKGIDMIPNALDKVLNHRDKGEECGVLYYTQSHRLADNSFRYGSSVCIDGTYVGGSGLDEHDDRLHCTILAARFNHAVQDHRSKWEVLFPREHYYWFSEKLEVPTRLLGLQDGLINKTHAMRRFPVGF